jgi:hypothetical protein
MNITHLDATHVWLKTLWQKACLHDFVQFLDTCIGLDVVRRIYFSGSVEIAIIINT